MILFIMEHNIILKGMVSEILRQKQEIRIAGFIPKNVVICPRFFNALLDNEQVKSGNYRAKTICGLNIIVADSNRNIIIVV